MWANKKKKKMCLHKPYLKEGRCRFSYVWLYDVFMCLCVLVDHQFVHGEFLSDLRSTVLCQDAALISVAMRPQDLSGIHSSMQATAKTWSRPLTARLWLPYRPTSPGLEKKKKKSPILTPFHWTNFRGSFCGDSLTVWLLCSSTSLPSHRMPYLRLPETRWSLSCSVPMASLALWTDSELAIFRMPQVSLAKN